MVIATCGFVGSKKHGSIVKSGVVLATGIEYLF
jgi:hypothetical protein